MFQAIALGGHKGAGKDTVAAHLLKTRTHAKLMRSKTPIVEAYERYYGVTYDKSHDSRLMTFSKEICRANDPLIVAKWLLREVPYVANAGLLPVIADMRFHDENKALLDCGALCIKIDADEDVCKIRTIQREGDLRNFNLNDPTEREIDDLKYHYIIDNNRNDGGEFAIAQLEEFLRRQGPFFAEGFAA